jgi:transcriptional regulator with XRE-family HTH domain
MVKNIILVELRKSIKNSGLQQIEIAKIIGTNVIHLNKVLNGKAGLTSNIMKKLSNIRILHINEHDLLYPDCKHKELTTFEQNFLNFLEIPGKNIN